MAEIPDPQAANGESENQSEFDLRMMARALQIAERGLYTASPNPRVGCVLVKNRKVIGEGWHHQTGQPHAEIEALNSCSEDVAGATAYVTLEPCAHYGRTPPCCDRLVQVGVARVVIAALDPNPLVSGNGMARIREAGIDVSTGLLQAESEQLNCGFFSRMVRKRPWVRLKLASSLDGRIALASGESKWITSPQARADVQHYRARADCILTGVGTVLADDPKMTVRLDSVDQQQQPLLAIVDSQIRTPATATLFESNREVLVFANKPAPSGFPATVIHQHSASAKGNICLSGMLCELAHREINEVHVEGGAQLAASLLTEQLVDELIIYQAPLLLGADSRALVELCGITSMEQRPEFEYIDVSPVGRDLRLTLKPLYNHFN